MRLANLARVTMSSFVAILIRLFLPSSVEKIRTKRQARRAYSNLISLFDHISQTIFAQIT